MQFFAKNDIFCKKYLINSLTTVLISKKCAIAINSIILALLQLKMGRIMKAAVFFIKHFWAKLFCEIERGVKIQKLGNIVKHERSNKVTKTRTEVTSKQFRLLEQDKLYH